VSDQDDDAAPAEPQECQPCRGTGKVISNLGGSPSTIDCPWCEGTGVFIPEHDAQAHWRSEGAADAPDAA
jgi:DnaJ-class molecular chaperone